ncbi:GPP34 family phosphoprotein [Ornithinimicrobium sp. Arc0846-15]|nr:GPP34 family phosphoprotein [Ornithinimicrobium laminariae]
MNTSLLPPQTLVAEDIFLLILDESRGHSLVTGEERTRLIASALVVDLVLSEVMDAVDNPTNAASFLLQTRPQAHSYDPLLDHPRKAVNGLATEPAIRTLRRRKHQQAVIKRLAERGYVHRRMLSTRLPQLNGHYEQQLRSALLDVLRHGREPNYREATLIALLLTVRKLATLFPREDSAAIHARAEEIANQHWIQKAQKSKGALDGAGVRIIEGIADLLSAVP